MPVILKTIQAEEGDSCRLSMSSSDFTKPGAGVIRSTSGSNDDDVHSEDHCVGQLADGPVAETGNDRLTLDIGPLDKCRPSLGRGQLSPATRARRTPFGAGNSAPSTPSTDRKGAAKHSSYFDRLGLTALVGGGSGGVAGQGSRLLSQNHLRRLLAAPTSGSETRERSDGNGGGSCELSVEACNPGVIKLYGDSLVQGAQYKSVLASTRSTARELLRQALERYGLPPVEVNKYVLCETVGFIDAGDDGSGEDSDREVFPPRDKVSELDRCPLAECMLASGGWRPVSHRVLHDDDKPLELHAYWRPQNGFRRRFELRRREDVARQGGSDDTSGLNENARRIMKAKVSPVVVSSASSSFCISSTVYRHAGTFAKEPQTQPLQLFKAQSVGHSALEKVSQSVGTGTLNKASQSIGAGALSNVSQTIGAGMLINNQQDTSLCPAVCPYFLTLRGYDITKDIVIYPLKAKTLTVGRSRGQADDIVLVADDVQDVHCRVQLHTLLPEHPHKLHKDRRYWYHLQIKVMDGAHVFLNGRHVDHVVTVFPGDLLGIGQHYLFLYKDPTAGYDIPQTLPWYPAAFISSTSGCKTDTNSPTGRAANQDQPSCPSDEVLSPELHYLDKLTKYCSVGGRPLLLAYARHREKEVVEYIANISCNGRGDFPLTSAALLLCCYVYVARYFSNDQLITFLKQMLEAVRNRVDVICKTLSQQKYQSAMFKPEKEEKTLQCGDPLFDLLCWLSNVTHLYSYLSSQDFGPPSSDQQPHSEVTDTFREVTKGLEEAIRFMFQQSVYSVTKELYIPVEEIVSAPAGADTGDRCAATMARVLRVLQVTSDIVEGVGLHRHVIIQLLTYLIFYITTTVFNKLVMNGSQYLCWSVGIQLQACVSRLEDWAVSVGLAAQYLQVAERLVALVDLLATSRHTLFRMDWNSFHKQYSPLSDAQLLRVLTGYRVGDGQRPPETWLPPPEVQHSSDDGLFSEVSIALTSHPPFVMPCDEESWNLAEKLTSAFFQHLESVQRHFLHKEAINVCEPSSPANKTRTSSSAHSSSQPFPVTFFTCNSPEVTRPCGLHPPASPPNPSEQMLGTELLSCTGHPQEQSFDSCEDGLNTPSVPSKNPVPLPRRALFHTAESSAHMMSFALTEPENHGNHGHGQSAYVNSSNADFWQKGLSNNADGSFPPQLLVETSSVTMETKAVDCMFIWPYIPYKQDQQGDTPLSSPWGFTGEQSVPQMQQSRPDVVQLAQCCDESCSHMARLARYPENIYIDVSQLEASGKARHLKVLSLEDGAGSPASWGKP